MGIPFFDSNPAIIDEMRIMDHKSKLYRKTLKKVLLEIGGLPYLFSALKSSPDGDAIRRKYFRQLVITGVFLLSMFVWLIGAALLVGDAGDTPIVGAQVWYLLVFLALEVATITLAMVYSFRARRVLLEGVTHLIDSYGKNSAIGEGQTLSTFRFERSKVNRIAIMIGIFIPLVIFTGIYFFNGFLEKVDSTQSKDFSKAGLTITLTEDFQEVEVVSQTAAYSTTRHLITILKEEFSILTDVGIPSDITLKDYAMTIIENNALDATVSGTDDQPFFKYERQANGKDFTYLATVYRGSDAYWMVTFACETKNYSTSEAQFLKWAETVDISSSEANYSQAAAAMCDLF